MPDASSIRRALLEGPEQPSVNLGSSIILTQKGIPPELRSLPRWLLWRWVRCGTRWRKVPLRMTSVGPAEGFSSARDASSLSTVPELLPFLEQSGNRGLMFCPGMHDGLNWVAVDLDDFDGGQLDRLPSGLAQLYSGKAGYWCLSPSGCGVRLIGHTGSTVLVGGRVCIDGSAVHLLTETATVTTASLLVGGPSTFDLRPQISSLMVDRRPGRANGLPKSISPPWGNFDEPKRRLHLLAAARSYLAELPDAVEGQGGGSIFYRACAVIACQFGLSGPDGEALAREWNASRCQPPFSEKDFQSKWAHAVQRSLDSTPSFAIRLAGFINGKSKLGNDRGSPVQLDGSPFDSWWA